MISAALAPVATHAAAGNFPAAGQTRFADGAIVRPVATPGNDGQSESRMRYIALSEIPDDAPGDMQVRIRRADLPGALPPIPYLSAARKGGDLRALSIKEFMARAHANCGTREGVCSKPQAAMASPNKAFFLREFGTFSSEQESADPGEPFTVNGLHSLLHAGDKPAPSFAGGAVPVTPALHALLSKLSLEGDRKLPAVGEEIDPVFVRERLGELALALFAPDQAANEVAFTDFSFLALASLQFTVKDAQKLLAAELNQHGSNGKLKSDAAAWAAALISSRLHPALSRTDVPDDVVFGDLNYAKLHFAIDLLQAAGLDHGAYSHRQLMLAADIVMAGSKLNPTFADSLTLLQLPSAFWFAHASGDIDLQTQALRDGDTVRRVLARLEDAQSKAWRGDWDLQEAAIDALEKAPPSREKVVADKLQSLGLNPYETHKLPWRYLKQWTKCGAEMRLVRAYLDDCRIIVQDKIGHGLPLLETLLRDARNADTGHRQSMLAAALGIALRRSDTQTRKDFEAKVFQIRTPLIERESILEGEVKRRDWIYSKLSVMIETVRDGETRHYLISPFNPENLIEPIVLEGDDILQARKDFVAKNPAMHFPPDELACKQPCDAVDFRQPGFLSVGDREHPRTVQRSPYHREEQVADFDNPNMPLEKRLLAIAQQMDVHELKVLHALHMMRLRGIPLSACFTTADSEQLDKDMQDCGLKLAPEDAAFMNIAPVQLFRTRARQYLFTAPFGETILEQTATRFIAQLPTAPARRKGKLADTLPAILRVRGETAADMRLNPHRLETARGLAVEFFRTLRKMLGSEASLSGMTAALDDAIRRNAEPPGSKHAAAPAAPPAAIILPASTMDASGVTHLRFNLTGVAHASRVYDSVLEGQGMFTFRLDDHYYRTDLREAYPRLVSVDRLKAEADHTELCREERALKESKKRICLTTHTVQLDEAEGDVVDGGSEDSHWHVIQPRSAAATEFVQSAPISGRTVQTPRESTVMFRTANEGAFAVRPGLAYLDDLLFDHNPNIAGPSSGPILSQYESLGPRAAAGQGIPPIAPLQPAMHAEIIFNGSDQRPMIRYERRSADSANPTHIDQSLTGSRLRTVIQRDFFSLPPNEETFMPARGLVEIADGVFYRFDLPPPQDGGSAPVGLTRLDSTADAAEIATFTTQETTERWIRTRGFSVDISPVHTNLYIDIIRNGARTLTMAALRQEIANRQRFGEHSTVVAEALEHCIESESGGAAEPPPEAVREALSVAMSAIARSPEMTRDWRNAVVTAFSGRDPERNPNMHFEEIYIAPTVPDSTGVLDFLDHELRRSLDLFAEVYEGLDFSHIFEAPSPTAPPLPPGAPNMRIEKIHEEFGRVIGQRRNVAIAAVTLRNGRRIIYHALSGTQKPPAFTSRASHNPQAYIYVDTGEGRIEPPLPWFRNLTPLDSEQNRADDTEQLLADRILRDHQDEIPTEGETEKERAAKIQNENAVAKVEIISLFTICQSCAPALVATARRLPHAEFVFADFPAPAKSAPALLKRISPRPLRSTARPAIPATRIPVHA